MDIHKNARLTPFGRERLVTTVLDGQTPQAALRQAILVDNPARLYDFPRG